MTEGQTAELIERLRHAYPDGVMENFDEGRGLPTEIIRWAVSILKDSRGEACLHAQLLWDMPCSYEVAYTLGETLPFADWISWNDQGKLSYLAMNEKLGAGFGVMMLRLSKVVPCYSYYFNVWREEGTTGRMTIDCGSEELMSDRWRDALRLLEGGAGKAGFVNLDSETARLVHPSITEVDFDDPSSRDDFDFDNPPRKPASLRKLVFGD